MHYSYYSCSLTVTNLTVAAQIANLDGGSQSVATRLGFQVSTSNASIDM